MANLFDRAAALVGTVVSVQFLEAPPIISDPSVNPTSASVGLWGGVRSSNLATYTFTASGVDTDGNATVTFFTTTKGNAATPPVKNPPITLAVIAADNNVTLIALGPFSPGSGWQRYFLFSNTNLNPATTVQQWPITDLTTSGFGAFPAPDPNPGACYVAGTRLTTDHGEVAVEDIRAGDMLVVLDDAAGETVRPVVWTGSYHVRLGSHPTPEMVRPVRIRAGAFADDMPHRDLLVSPDHAILIDGVLVPAHLLVNGGSIVQDATFDTLEYFHVELDRHSAVLAEGLAAETYLSGANRLAFGEPGVTALHPSFQDADAAVYAEHGFAPLMLDAAVVEPVWARLATRSAALGLDVVSVEATADAALRITVDGVALTPMVDGATYRVALPSGTTQVRLVSRSARPSDMRPWLDDRRELGVMVRAVTVVTGDVRESVAIDSAALTVGWWAVERDGADARRWTDGNAAIVLPAAAAHAMLEIELTGEMSYPMVLRQAA